MSGILSGSLLTGCATLDGSTATPFPTTITDIRALTDAEVEVWRDPNGRPYDVTLEWAEPTRIERQSLTMLHIPDGELAVGDGNSIEIDPSFFLLPADIVHFDHEELEASVIWEHYEGGRAVLGILLQVPHSQVDSWGPFEGAYGTDGGEGGIISWAAVEKSDSPWKNRDFLYRDLDLDVEVFDADGEPGDDTIVFANGVGDGGFPMSRGFDRDGQLVALYVFDNRYPWRLMISQGTPPEDVTTREDQLLSCLAGTGAIHSWDGVEWHCSANGD